MERGHKQDGGSEWDHLDPGLGCRGFLGGHAPYGEEAGDINDQNWDGVRWQVPVECGLK